MLNRTAVGSYQRFAKNYSAKGHVVYQHTQNLKQILLKTRRAARARADFSEKNQPYCRPTVSRTAMSRVLSFRFLLSLAH
jgi:hypothetical protein